MNTDSMNLKGNNDQESDNQEMKATSRASTRRALAAILLASLGATPTLRAGVAAVGEIEVLATTPPSVKTGVLESDDWIRLFREQTGVTLTSNLAVDVTVPGVYDDASPTTPGSIPAGTVVNSYFLHLDRVGVSGPLVVRRGFVTFDEVILGVIFSDANLNASDGLLGTSAYSTNSFRGLLSGMPGDAGDIVIWDCGMSLELELPIYNVTDQVRVITAPARKLDYGDAPDSYRTTLAAGGARHRVVPQLYLGAFADLEADGAPSAAADCDDATSMYPGLDDETGLVSVAGLTPGSVATLGISATINLLKPAYIDGWLDMNGDGTFNHPMERIIPSALVPSSGTHYYNFALPGWAMPGVTYARFRISSVGGLLPAGYANDGEVEDYRVVILP